LTKQNFACRRDARGPVKARRAYRAAVVGQLGANGTKDQSVVAQVEWHCSALDRQLMLRLPRSAMHWQIPTAVCGAAAGLVVGAAGAGRGAVLTGRLSRGAAAAGTAITSNKHPAWRRARIIA
jgi:hypothetical protein